MLVSTYPRPMTLRVATKKDRASLVPLVAHSYGIPRAKVPGWFDRSELTNVWAYEEDDELTGCLHALPMGQFFGEGRISTVGVQGVAIGVPKRGKGNGARMMQSFLRTMRDRKFALSTLYAATFPLYRGVGYERAGMRFCTTVDMRQQVLPRGQETRVVRELPSPDTACKKLYRTFAPTQHGYLDRGPSSWRRICDPRDIEARTFTITGRKGLEGYVVIEHKMTSVNASTVNVLDVVATTRSAALEIWRLLQSYSSIAGEVTLWGGADSLMHAVLPERHYRVEFIHTWMLRVLNPTAALIQRGYPPVSARITFLLSDAALPENSGAYTLSVVKGKATVRKTSREQGVRISERGLAALYSGFQSATALRTQGLLDATDAECSILAALFSSPTPAMADMF